MRVLGERPDVQAAIRADRSRIPVFLEETLRLESPVKSHFRFAAETTSVGECPIAAGTTIMLLPGASNRDPEKFEEPGSSGWIGRMCVSTSRSDAAHTPARCAAGAGRAGSR